VRVTPKRRQTFLAELAEHGIVARAARMASPHSADGCTVSFRDLRRRDIEFARLWDEALEQSRARVEHELHRRAVEGWEEPIYGGKHKERIVGTVRRYSDRLLELRAKALLPEYREHSKLDLGGRMSLRPETMDSLAELTREEREQVRDLLQSIAAREEREAAQ